VNGGDGWKVPGWGLGGTITERIGNQRIESTNVSIAFGTQPKVGEFFAEDS
jgi:hypothetical protein